MGNRRSLVGVCVAAVAALVVRHGSAENAAGRELCSWGRVGSPYCYGGVLQQNWCYRCCEADSGCQNVTCETRSGGPC